MSDLYTVKQVQDLLKVDRITVYRMLQDGRLKGIKIGHQWRFTAAELEHLAGGRVVNTGRPGLNYPAIYPSIAFKPSRTSFPISAS